MWHLFIPCTQATSFWNRFQEWYSISSNTKLLLLEVEVMFGITSCHSYCLALNHLIILGKYFLYVNALNTLTHQFDDFVSLVREKINLEKYLAVTSNKDKEFKNNWIFFYFYNIPTYQVSDIEIQHDSKCMKPQMETRKKIRAPDGI